MGIHLVDLIVESVIRDGLAYLSQNPSLIDDIFSPLTQTYTNRKYGENEIEKIKTMLQTKNIAIVHSFHSADAKAPCYSIQLGSESEALNRQLLDDHEDEVLEDITDSDILAGLVKVESLIPTSYDSVSGLVSVDDEIDLSNVWPAFIYEDSEGTEFEILGVTSESPKGFYIAKNATPEITDPGLIKSFITESQYTLRQNTSQVNILIGVHSKDVLITKYLYTILKYILASRKTSMMRRGLHNTTFQGSDFTRDLRYEGDQVYTRFYTLTGQIDDHWRAGSMDLIDHVEVFPTLIE